MNRDALGVLALRQNEARQRQQKEQDDDREFNQRLRLAGIESALRAGEAGYNVQTGQLESRTPKAFDPSTLKPGESAHVPLPGGGYRNYTGPTTPKSPGLLTPYQNAQALSQLQELEMNNQAIQAEATPKQGGFSKFFGLPAPTAPTNLPGMVDTSGLRRQLQPMMTGQAGQGAPHASQVTPEDINDLVQGVQQGMIQSRQQAMQVILQAGLDPNDPAFADILRQLP